MELDLDLYFDLEHKARAMLQKKKGIMPVLTQTPTPIPTTPVQGYGDGRFAASSYTINKKKVLVE